MLLETPLDFRVELLEKNSISMLLAGDGIRRAPPLPLLLGPLLLLLGPLRLDTGDLLLRPVYWLSTKTQI